MKKRSRCLRCGRFIRNGNYCQRCVDLHRKWCIGMKEMNYPNDNEDGRLEVLGIMVKEMERL